MLELLLLLLNLSCNVNQVAHWNCETVGTNHETRCVTTLLSYHFNRLQVSHLNDYTVVSLVVVLTDYVQIEFNLWSNVLLIAYGSHTADNRLNLLNSLDKLQLLLAWCVKFEFVTHDALVILAVIDVLPQLFCDERHEWMQHLQE